MIDLNLDEKPLVLILLGPPGSGKGTHAVSLAKEMKIPHISTGDLFREHIQSLSPVGKIAKEYIDEGKLVPDEIVLKMLFERIQKADCKHGFILDGFPRTLPQALVLDKMLQMQANCWILSFLLDDEIIVERISGRISCRSCSSPFHKRFAPPLKEMICDHCNLPLYQREDDQEEIIRKRLAVYKKETAPLIAHYEKQKTRFREIDSALPKEEVFQSILKCLPQTISAY